MTELYNRFVDSLRASFLGPVINWIDTHPRLAAWIFLATGMVIILVIEARDVGLLAGQWIALIVTTILVAGACVWIISFEDEEDDDDEPANK
ncbi:MAG: hypothetical protein GYB64_15535 [Chloroflexi bacterium]|nr:hypothetical protein [Chloroflexota bacterium]